MEWQKLTKKTLPPVDTAILLWLDYRRFGFPVCGSYSGDELILYCSCDGLVSLDRDEWRHTRWALIDPPEGEET